MGTRAPCAATASASTSASSSTTSETTRCSHGSSASSASRRRSRRCRSRSRAPAGSSTPAGDRSRSRRRSVDPRHLGLLWEIGRWLRTANRSLDELDCEHWSLERYLDERRFSQRFRRHFLVPLTAALWSTAPGRALEYPAGCRDPLLRESRHARLPPLPLALRERRQRRVRAQDRRQGSANGSNWGRACGRSAAGRRRRADDGRRRAASRSTRW